MLFAGGYVGVVDRLDLDEGFLVVVDGVVACGVGGRRFGVWDLDDVMNSPLLGFGGVSGGGGVSAESIKSPHPSSGLVSSVYVFWLVCMSGDA